MIPPAAVPPLLHRAALEARLDEIWERRLSVLVAPAGFGKSTVLAAWANSRHCAWCTVDPADHDVARFASGILAALRLRAPRISPLAPASVLGPEADSDPARRAAALAEQVASTLFEHLHRPVALVLDDVHEIGEDGPANRFLADMIRQAPPELHVVVASRTRVAFPTARLRAQGQVGDVTGADLAFTREETAALVEAVVGVGTREVADRLHELTGGWPAAVRLAADALKPLPADRWPTAVEQAAHPDGPIDGFLVEEVLPRAGPDVVALLVAACLVSSFDADLLEVMAVDQPEAAVAGALRSGLVVVPDAGRPTSYALIPVVRDFARRRLAPDPDRRRSLLVRASRALATRGDLDGALAAALDADESDAVLGLLATAGSALLAGPSRRQLTEWLATVEPEARTPVVILVEGAARFLQGDWDGALRCFEPALAGDEPVPKAAVLIAALVHHWRGDLSTAIELYERTLLSPGTPAEQARALGWAAAAYWLRGDVERCRSLAMQAVALAEEVDDHEGAAAGWTALAMAAAVDGDRRANDLHYLRALEHAELAGDSLQLTRIHSNRGSRFLEEGYYEEALVELDAALRIADMTGLGWFRALALSNRGEALIATGRLEEAEFELVAARDAYQRLGSRMVSYPLAHLGDVYRFQGQASMARSCYEEAISVASEAGDVQGLVPALTGLALLVVDRDVDEATALADRALEAGPALSSQRALLARARVALARGERAVAAEAVAEAEALARARRDRARMADALELASAIAEDSSVRQSNLDEADRLWEDLGNPLGRARVLLLRARVASARGDAAAVVELAAEAEEALRAIGAHGLAAEAASLASQQSVTPPTSIAVEVLGRFRVHRDGVAIGAREWQSRKARDLLKILVGRYRQPVPRDVLLELLWPGEDPARTASRLSVTLSTLRSVLDPDKRFEPNQFVASDRGAAWLVVDHVAVDLEEFLDAAAAGLALLAQGRTQEASKRLAGAEARYAGDFCEEDPYEDWTVSIREQARAVFASVLRALTSLSLTAGEHDLASRYGLRLLARDPYDEPAHLAMVEALVAAGRHGDARRAYRIYSERMADIEVEPRPFPAAELRPKPA